MDLHHKALNNLHIDPDTSPGLVHIYSEEPPTPFSGHPHYKANYQHIVRHFLEQTLYSEELHSVLNDFYRSPMSLTAQYADMEKMNQPPVTILKDEHYHLAFRRVMDTFRPSKPVRVLHYVRTKHYPWQKSSNVERPFSTDKRVIKYVKNRKLAGEIESEKMSFFNTFNYVYGASRLPIHKIKDGQCFTGDLEKDYLYPITAHFRPGLGKPGSTAIKNRLVWGVSKILLIAECMFMYPLFNDYLRHGTSPMLWGYETILGGWTKLHDELQPLIMEHPSTIITADWSEFDHRVPFELIESVINASLDYYDLGFYQPDYRYHTRQNCAYDIERIKNLFKWTIYATLTSPLLMPDGKVWIRTRNGIPSGMFRTQWLDSIINGIMITTLLSEAGFDVSNKLILKVLGDDSLSVIFHQVPPSQWEPLKSFLSQRALTRFNAKLSYEKTEISDSLWNMELLGYRNLHGAALRNPIRLLAQLLYPESESPTYASLMGRCVGIAYADLGRSPRLYRVCKNIYQYLKDQGYSPSLPPALNMLTGPLFTEVRQAIVVKTFPTVQEIQLWTRTPYVRSDADNDAYWPPDIFMNDYSN